MTMPPVSDTRLDYPVDWNKKSNLIIPVLFLAILILTLFVCAIGFGYSFVTAAPWPGVLLSPVLSASFAVAGIVIFVIAKKKLRKAYLYIDSFHAKVKALAKARHGLDLSRLDVDQLLSFVSDLTGAPTIYVNFGNHRVSIVLRPLTEGEDIRFYHAETIQELATISQQGPVVAKTEQKRFDLPKSRFRYVVGRNQYWMEFRLIALPLLVMCYGLIAIPRLVFTSDTLNTVPTVSTLMLIGAISFVVLVIWGVWLRHYHRSANAETVIAQATFFNIVRDRYGLTLSNSDVKSVYGGRTLVTEAGGKRLDIYMSTLLGGKDVKLIEEQTGKELAIL